MKFGVKKLKKCHSWNFEKDLDQGLSAKIWGFEHFLQKRSLKVSNFLHDDSRQKGALFEDGAILRETFNLGLGIGGGQGQKNCFCSF